MSVIFTIGNISDCQGAENVLHGKWTYNFSLWNSYITF